MYVVRGNYDYFWLDLEMFYIVEFGSVLVNIGARGSISAGCLSFYPVAFFLKAVSVISLSEFNLCKVKNLRFSIYLPLKKSHWVKNLAPGRNRPSGTYIDPN